MFIVRVNLGVLVMQGRHEMDAVGGTQKHIWRERQEILGGLLEDGAIEWKPRDPPPKSIVIANPNSSSEPLWLSGFLLRPLVAALKSG